MCGLKFKRNTTLTIEHAIGSFPRHMNVLAGRLAFFTLFGLGHLSLPRTRTRGLSELHSPANTNQTARHPVAVASLWMVGAILSFSAMAVAGRSLSNLHDTFEIMLFRSIFGVAIVVAIALYAGTLGQIRTRRLGTHFLRNVFHFTGQNLWFYALTLIPLAQVFALEFTTPLWVMLIAALFLGERITRLRLISAMIGFVGILIVTRPFAGTLETGVFFAAGSAVGFAGAAIGTKMLTRTDSVTCILFWLTTMQTVFGLLMAGYDGQITTPTLQTLPWLALIGICGLIAHFCLTTALSLAPASVITPVDFLRLPIIAVIGMLVYSEALDPWVFIGGVLIFAGNYFNIRGETRIKATAG